MSNDNPPTEPQQVCTVEPEQEMIQVDVELTKEEHDLQKMKIDFENKLFRTIHALRMAITMMPPSVEKTDCESVLNEWR